MRKRKTFGLTLHPGSPHEPLPCQPPWLFAWCTLGARRGNLAVAAVHTAALRTRKELRRDLHDQRDPEAQVALRRLSSFLLAALVGKDLLHFAVVDLLRIESDTNPRM